MVRYGMTKSISPTPSFRLFSCLLHFLPFLYSEVVVDRLIYYVSTTLNTGGDSPICRKFLRFDAHFGITGYGCSGSATEDRYQLFPWSGFGFKANIVPLGVTLETCNAKITEVSINKNKRNIEIQLSAPAPEITKGMIIIKGLNTGMYQVSDNQDSRQYQVLREGILRVEDVSSMARIEIQAE